MTGPEHYEEAERLLALARKASIDVIEDRGIYAFDPSVPNLRHVLADAQVHATLALAAAAALDTGRIPENSAWHEVAATELSKEASPS